MANYLVVDSGGTKVAAVLYDEHFTPLKKARVGSMRGNTTSRELIEKNVLSLVEQLGITEGMTLNRITGVCEGEFGNKLKELCTIEKTTSYGEHNLGLYAAGIFGDGMLSLSGTGATMFAKYNNAVYTVGGYGAAVSDEGSGYWMSRHAFDYAIKGDEGRGEKTLLTDLIAEHFDRKTLREAIFSIYSLPNTSPTAAVASCAPLVEKAANAGDAVALKLVEMTGRALAEQMIVMMNLYAIPHTLPITMSGSVWRGHPLMFRTFRDVLMQYDDSIQIVIPEFEPIVGAMIGHYYEMYGKFDAEDKEKFKKEYPEYLFTIKI